MTRLEIAGPAGLEISLGKSVRSGCTWKVKAPDNDTLFRPVKERYDVKYKHKAKSTCSNV